MAIPQTTESPADTMKVVTEAALAGKRVLLRVDFNVPLDEHQTITDDLRIRQALPTIRHILQDGASLVLMSHLGRPKGKPDPKLSLSHVQDHLENLLETKVQFVGDCIGEAALEAARALQPGEVLLVENTRFHPEEKKGTEDFARQLAQLGEVYVNDAFGAAHRAHASTATVARFFEKTYAGLLMAHEVDNASKVLNHPAKPYVLIAGGAKISDKIELLKNLLPRVDSVIIGGGMAYTFLKAQGYEIGGSLCEEDKLGLARELIAQAEAEGKDFLLPADSLVAEQLSADAAAEPTGGVAVPPGKMGLDIGPKSIANARELILTASTILWNGPMGVFEYDQFAKGTVAMAHAVAEATGQGAYSLIGGGDSAAAVAQAGLEDKVSYISTGGGALLEYLEGKPLPGIHALNDTPAP